jgi:tRNA/tmRNA/rRNA uracil-C5-methylase (TrmA/RlmC/RlmD family)
VTHDISQPPSEATGAAIEGTAERPAGARLNWVGRQLVVRVGLVAHGGHFVARHEGRVIFVRHALEGELATVEVTEDLGGSFCRADAVAIAEPSASRVPAPCEHARPGGCGGCDFQHIALSEQRRLKAAVVEEQLSRLAGLERAVTVEALDETGLRWRRRIRYAVAPNGQLGLRAHRSHAVIALDDCPIGAPGVGDQGSPPAPLGKRWPGRREIEVATDDRGEVAITGYRADQPPPRSQQRRRRGRSAGRDGGRRAAPERLRAEPEFGPATLTYEVGGRVFSVRAAGFWQTHPAAAAAFSSVVLAAAAPLPGERVLDLYAGAGLFTVPLAAAVGDSGQVVGVEGDRSAADDANHNLAGLPQASVRASSVSADVVERLSAELGGVDVIVLDPPRTGAGRAVMQALTSCPARVIVYVACDPAALARDLRTAQDAGWELAELRAFDAFPMTHHVECIAVLRRADEPTDPA